MDGVIIDEVDEIIFYCANASEMISTVLMQNALAQAHLLNTIIVTFDELLILMDTSVRNFSSVYML